MENVLIEREANVFTFLIVCSPVHVCLYCHYYWLLFMQTSVGVQTYLLMALLPDNGSIFHLFSQLLNSSTSKTISNAEVELFCERVYYGRIYNIAFI